jgi:hypothetical protein
MTVWSEITEDTANTNSTFGDGSRISPSILAVKGGASSVDE